MNKLKKFGPKRIVIFYPGEIVKFKCPGCNIIGVVVGDANYIFPNDKRKEGHFNIRTLIRYSYINAYAESFKTVGEIGGNFTHCNWNNLVKLTAKQIKRLGMQLILSTYE